MVISTRLNGLPPELKASVPIGIVLPEYVPCALAVPTGAEEVESMYAVRWIVVGVSF